MSKGKVNGSEISKSKNCQNGGTKINQNKENKIYQVLMITNFKVYNKRELSRSTEFVGKSNSENSVIT